MAHTPYKDRDFLLSYSTNVHPGESVDDLVDVVRKDVAAVKSAAFPDAAMGLNLRLGMKQLDALASAAERDRLAEAMADTNTFLFTVNNPELIHFTYQRYLENKIRDTFGFDRTHLKLVFRGK